MTSLLSILNLGRTRRVFPLQHCHGCGKSIIGNLGIGAQPHHIGLRANLPALVMSPQQEN
jgi:hypothetical protein